MSDNNTVSIWHILTLNSKYWEKLSLLWLNLGVFLTKYVCMGPIPCIYNVHLLALKLVLHKRKQMQLLIRNSYIHLTCCSCNKMQEEHLLKKKLLLLLQKHNLIHFCGRPILNEWRLQCLRNSKLKENREAVFLLKHIYIHAQVLQPTCDSIHWGTTVINSYHAQDIHAQSTSIFPLIKRQVTVLKSCPIRHRKESHHNQCS